MYRLFAALAELVPGSRVIDVAFTVLPGTAHAEVDLAEIDLELAEALEGAEPADISTLI
jgi:hypothetical protein